MGWVESDWSAGRFEGGSSGIEALRLVVGADGERSEVVSDERKGDTITFFV